MSGFLYGKATKRLFSVEEQKDALRVRKRDVAEGCADRAKRNVPGGRNQTQDAKGGISCLKTP